MRGIISLTKLDYFQEGTNRIIFAYGNADPSTNNDFQYHGTNRGTKSLFLLNPDRGVSNIRPTERVHTLDFLNDNVRPSRHLYIVLFFNNNDNRRDILLHFLVFVIDKSTYILNLNVYNKERQRIKVNFVQLYRFKIGKVEKLDACCSFILHFVLID